MIRKLIAYHATRLKGLPPSLDAEALLWAFYHSERYSIYRKEPRFDPAFAPEGLYYRLSKQVRDEYQKWGKAACCCYSNFQMPYLTAVELGYNGPPLALDRDRISLPFVILHLTKRIRSRAAQTPEEVADAYNSLSYRSFPQPYRYLKRFRHFYDRALKRAQTCKDTTKKQDASTTSLENSPAE